MQHRTAKRSALLVPGGVLWGIFVLLTGCQAVSGEPVERPKGKAKHSPLERPLLAEGERVKKARPDKKSRDYLVAHLFVALCDNKYQGIVPTGKALGDGQNPDTNLYWGAGYGVRSFFNKKRGWKRLSVEAPEFPILERIAFEKTLGGQRMIVIAEAYDGRNIMDSIGDFLRSGAGAHPVSYQLSDPKDPEQQWEVQAGGYSDLIAYVGHNGLMDNPPPEFPARLTKDNPKDAVILACIADAYFQEHLARAGVRPLVWTTNLMAPEAYTLEAILHGRLRQKTPYEVREMAAEAYDKYQSCGRRAARRLFASTPDGSGYPAAGEPPIARE